MKVAEEQKAQLADRLWEITQACYTGVEVPREEFFRRVVRDGDVFVEIVRGEVIGYALVTLDNVRPLLRSVAVMPTFRGYGVGRQLLDELAAHYAAKGCTSVILHCKVGNPAQKLYFDAGYRVRAYLRNYYAPEGDGLEMEKKLCVKIL